METLAHADAALQRTANAEPSGAGAGPVAVTFGGEGLQVAACGALFAGGDGQTPVPCPRVHLRPQPSTVFYNSQPEPACSPKLSNLVLWSAGLPHAPSSHLPSRWMAHFARPMQYWLQVGSSQRTRSAVLGGFNRVDVRVVRRRPSGINPNTHLGISSSDDRDRMCKVRYAPPNAVC
jgi:hypothetical protein